jgi:hypothetical protein
MTTPNRPHSHDRRAFSLPGRGLARTGAGPEHQDAGQPPMCDRCEEVGRTTITVEAHGTEFELRLCDKPR